LDPAGGFLPAGTCFGTLTATELVAEGGVDGVTGTASFGNGAEGVAGTTATPSTGGAAALGEPAPVSLSASGRESSVSVTIATTPAPSRAAKPSSHLLAARAGAGSCAERATACTLANVPAAPGSEAGVPGSEATKVAPSPKLGELRGRGVAGGFRVKLERGAEKPGALSG
jgi:hypothetical protein